MLYFLYLLLYRLCIHSCTACACMCTACSDTNLLVWGVDLVEEHFVLYLPVHSQIYWLCIPQLYCLCLHLYCLQ
jgi:hypothetical protein